MFGLSINCSRIQGASQMPQGQTLDFYFYCELSGTILKLCEQVTGWPKSPVTMPEQSLGFIPKITLHLRTVQTVLTSVDRRF